MTRSGRAYLRMPFARQTSERAASIRRIRITAQPFTADASTADEVIDQPDKSRATQQQAIGEL